MRLSKIGLLLLLFLLGGANNKEERAAAQKAGELKGTVSCKYLLYLPKGYGEKGVKWPLIMCLHGDGERGDNLELLKKSGLSSLVEQGKDFQFVIVSPQCPQKQSWPGKLETLISLLDDLEAKYEVDTDRIYLTGASSGGFGCWALGCFYPQRFAAIAPICGGGDRDYAEDMKMVPVWAFHGAKDTCVPLVRSQEMVDIIKSAGGEAKLTIYPEAGHDATVWMQTYENPELYKWFLSHRISDRKNTKIAVKEVNEATTMTQKAKTIKTQVEYKYLLYLPEGYGEKDKKWPLVLFLHGAGERGSNLEDVKKNGLPKLIAEGKKFEFIIVSPQCPQKQWWSGKAETLLAMLDAIESKYDVDKDRVYLTGLSMGGFGSWALGCLGPDRFAAIVPICGGGDKIFAGNMKDVPIWAFHGAKDTIVPLARSQEMVDAVNAAGGNAKLTIYPEAEHDSWTQTYENPELYRWLLSHRISDRKK